MNQTKHPAEIAYDNGGWDDDDMDTLAHPLRDPNPDRAAQGAAAYRKVLENQLHLSQNVQPHAGYRLWIEDEITAIYFWTNGGSDPLVIQVHGLKGSQARGIIDPTKGVEHIYSDESRVKMLARQYLERHGVSA